MDRGLRSPARRRGAACESLPRFADVLAAPEQPAIVAVDMPIGLPERTGPGGRAAENAVRPLLGARQSSVFSVPSRAAIYAGDYGEACRIAQATSDPPRKVSKQLFNIAPKIREVDECLRATPDAAGRVFEVHPEVGVLAAQRRAAADRAEEDQEPALSSLAWRLRRNLLIAGGLPPEIVNAAAAQGRGAGRPARCAGLRRHRAAHPCRPGAAVSEPAAA